jgi:hypothetical protein
MINPLLLPLHLLPQHLVLWLSRLLSNLGRVLIGWLQAHLATIPGDPDDPLPLSHRLLCAVLYQPACWLLWLSGSLTGWVATSLPDD